MILDDLTEWIANAERRMASLEAELADLRSVRKPAKGMLKLPEVCNLVGLSKSTIYAKMAESKFPPGVNVGGARRWKASDVQAWDR